MRYMAKVLQNCLSEKFPDASEEELMKVGVRADVQVQAREGG